MPLDVDVSTALKYFEDNTCITEDTTTQYWETTRAYRMAKLRQLPKKTSTQELAEYWEKYDFIPEPWGIKLVS